MQFLPIFEDVLCYKTELFFLSFFFFFDADTTYRMMSDRTSTKRLTTGWRPSARRESSWVETNPTWQTWWGHTAVFIYRWCVHWARIKTQLKDTYIKCSGLLIVKSFNPFPFVCRLCLVSSEWWRACRHLMTWWKTPRWKTGTGVWRARRSTTRAAAKSKRTCKRLSDPEQFQPQKYHKLPERLWLGPRWKLFFGIGHWYLFFSPSILNRWKKDLFFIIV